MGIILASVNPHGKFIGNELKYISEFLDSENPKNKKEHWIGRFEKAFVERFKAKYAIAHNSGTSALHSCLVASGVGPGDEVVMPAQTVAMLAFVVFAQSGIPVFADIDKDTFNVSPADIERKITPKTKAIIAVHMHGLSADMDPIMALGRKYGICVIEDSCQCMLGFYKGRLAGTIGDMASFSFEAKKHVSCGEGGMVLTNNQDYATKVRKFGGLGYKRLSAASGLRQLLPAEFQDPDYKRHDSLGLNYRMPEICAALGLAQFERVDFLVKRRRKVAGYFLDALRGCSWIIPQKVPQGYVHSYWTFTVNYEGQANYGISWKKFYELYKKNGGDGFYGGLSVVYEELFMRAYRDKHKYAKGFCPVAESLQPKIMQFKTNYRDLKIAKIKASALARTIKEIEG